jgi:hypothetical protein
MMESKTKSHKRDDGSLFIYLWMLQVKKVIHNNCHF